MSSILINTQKTLLIHGNRRHKDTLVYVRACVCSCGCFCVRCDSTYPTSFEKQWTKNTTNKQAACPYSYCVVFIVRLLLFSVDNTCPNHRM